MVKSLLRVDSTQSYWENTKNPIQDFIDFAMKTIKNWKKISKFVFVVSVQNHEDIRESNNNMWKKTYTCDEFVKKIQFSMSFYRKIYKILDRAFCIFPITLGRVDPQQWLDHQNITNWSLHECLIFFWKSLEGSGENWKKRGGQIFFNCFPC